MNSQTEQQMDRLHHVTTVGSMSAGNQTPLVQETVADAAYLLLPADAGDHEDTDESFTPEEDSSRHKTAASCYSEQNITILEKCAAWCHVMKSKKIDNSPQYTAPGYMPLTKVSIRRYLILALFCLYSMSSAYQWIHLSIIYDVIDTYYNSSLPRAPELKSLAIDSLSIVYMIAYIPLVFPAMWLLDKKGLRLCAVLATLLNATGAWLKCAAVHPDRYPLLLAAQTTCAVAQIFILAVPTRLAAVWFGPTQVSTATAVGVFGNQVGVALGFVLPPYLVKLHTDDLSLTGRALSYMFYGGAGYTTVLFLLVVFVFSDAPKYPPSMAQYKASLLANTDQHYLKSLKSLIKNWPFMLLVISYGMNVGVFYGISTLLNPVLFGYFNRVDFPRINEDAGWIGLTIVIAGLVGSVIGGIVLDRTKHFKATTIVLYTLSLSGMVLFTFTLPLARIWVVYITAGALGFFMTGYIPVGFEFGAELTYPEPEGSSSGLLNASAQMFGIFLTLAMGQLIRQNGDIKVNIRNSMLLAVGILLLGVIITTIIKNNLFRQIAETHHQHTHPLENNEYEPDDTDKLELSVPDSGT